MVTVALIPLILRTREKVFEARDGDFKIGKEVIKEVLWGVISWATIIGIAKKLSKVILSLPLTKLEDSKVFPKIYANALKDLLAMRKIAISLAILKTTQTKVKTNSPIDFAKQSCEEDLEVRAKHFTPRWENFTAN